MSTCRHDPLRPVFLQSLHRLRRGPGGVYHIVKNYCVLASDITDDMHDLRNIGSFPSFIYDGQ